MRRITILALVMALVAIPTAAFALDDAETNTTTVDERPERSTDATDQAETDRVGLEEAKQRALELIERQLATLRVLEAKVDNARHITDDHAAQLKRDIGAATDGLTELARKIEAAQTRQELAELVRQIDDWKIAQVLAPKVHQVIASDAAVYATGELERWAGKLADVIARFEEAGFDVNEAWRLLEEMEDNTAEALRLADPVAENVIGLQAADWPDPAQGILAQGRSDLHAAAGNMRAAFGNAKDIVQFLRNLSDATTDVALTG